MNLSASSHSYIPSTLVKEFDQNEGQEFNFFDLTNNDGTGCS